MNDQLRTYQQMHISGLNQKELIVLLYSGALRYIEEGKESIARKDVPSTHDNLNKARNIFIHLLSTLNMDANKEFATRLSALYAYFIEKITVGNVKKDIKELDDIIPLIQDIKDAWDKIEIDDGTMPNAKKASGLKPLRVFSTEV